ncbi:MAG: cysteine desulfurase NifS [Rhodospirillales bacterium]|nr:cysteine desulfurase NifS [Rhodospirillales bacterium]
MNGIYLDNNATTRVDPLVVEAMLPFFTERFGNPSSMHSFGDGVSRHIGEARSHLQALLGAEFDHEIVFTSCGTESDNAAIISALQTQPDRREIVTSAVEHPAVLSLCRHLEEREGYRLHVIPVDSKGRLDIDAFAAVLSPRVAIASIMWANNETGTIFPVERLARLAKVFGIMFHSDAVQAVGKVPMNVKNTDIDMVSLSGHKLHAPKGTGALYVRRGTRFRPLLRGGHQERGRRAGTENTTGIVGLGRACELALDHMADENGRVRALRDKLEKGIVDRIGDCFVTGDRDNRLPNTSNIAFSFIEGEAILLHLNRAGIAASSGSACTSGSLEPSHVMRAMDVPFTAAHGSIRFSLSRDTTEAEIDSVLEVLPPIVQLLREMSPFWSERGAAPAGFTPAYA